MSSVHFFHGAWGNPAQHLPFVQVLCRHFFVNAAPLLGHGCGEDPGGLSIHDFSACARGAVSKPVVLVGHSMGALVAQYAASRNARVQGLVLLAPAPPPRTLYKGEIWRRVWKYLPALLSGRAFELTDDDSRALLLHPAQEARVRFRSESGRAVRDLVLGQFFGFRPKVTCPVLVVAAEEDTMMPLPVCKQIAHIYGADFAVVRGAGHMLTCEPWAEETAGIVRTWIHERVASTTTRPHR